MLKATLRYVGFFVGIFVLLTMIVEVIFRFGLRESTIERINETVNNKMTSQVKFSNVSFSIIENFPDATLNIFDVDVVEQGYHILQFEELEIQFNPLDWFKDNILFEKVEIWNGQFYAPIDSAGRKFMIQGKANPESAAAELNFDVPEIEIFNLTVRVTNEYKGNLMLITVDTGFFELNASPDIISFSGNAWGKLDSMMSKGKVDLVNRPIAALDATMRINTVDNQKIFDGTMRMLEADLHADGVITPTGYGNLLDITLQTDHGNLDNWMKLIPGAGVGFKQLNPDAYLSLKIKNTGYVDAFAYPFLDIQFAIHEASFSRDNLPYVLENVTLVGLYTNGKEAGPKTSKFVIDSGHFEMNDSYLTISGTIEDFTDPIVAWDLKTQLVLDEIFPIPELPNFKNVKGTATAMINLDGRLSELEANSKRGLRKFDGSLDMTGVSLQLIEPNYAFTEMNGKLELNNERVSMNNLKGKVNGSNFSINGEVGNFLPLFSDDPNKIARGDLDIFLENIEIPQSSVQPKSGNTASTSIPSLPGNLAVNLNFRSNAIGYDKYKIADLGARIYLDNDSITLKQMKFGFGEGRVNLTGLVRQHEGQITKIKAWLDADFNHLDLDKLLSDNKDTTSTVNPNKSGGPTIHIFSKVDADRLTFQEHEFQSVSLRADYSEKDLSIKRLNLSFPFGRIKSSFDWRQVDSIQWLKGNFELDLEHFEADSLKSYFLSFSDDDSVSTEGEKEALYDSLDIDLVLKAKSIQYKAIKAQHVDGQLKAIKGGLLLDHLNAEIFQGRLSINGSLNEDEQEHRTLVANLDANNFDLGELVTGFNDPGKDLFTQETFRGKLDIGGKMILNYDENLQHKSRDMIGKIDLSVRDAQIRDFAPIKESLKFIKKQNRERIYLANQRMTVLFHNDELIMPQTVFESSISNIEMFGYHSLEFDFGFDMKVSVSDLLFKSRNKKIQNLQSGQKAQVKGLNYYLSARNEDGKLKVNSMKKRNYRHDLKRLEQRYQHVDSLLKIERRKLK